jgi:ribonuclease HII
MKLLAEGSLRSNAKSEPPNLVEENKLTSQGYQLIAGIDEVGRGALAGPVVAGAVILPESVNCERLAGVRDSKELTPGRRELLYNLIIDESFAFAIGIISSQLIDFINILNATRLAMLQAIDKLSCTPDFVLVDGMTIPELDIPQKGIIKGDKLSLSIACASIVAKVTRDRMMVQLNDSYPSYGLSRHKGYGTKYHLDCLSKYGPSPIHRFTFAPVKEAIKQI